MIRKLFLMILGLIVAVLSLATEAWGADREFTDAIPLLGALAKGEKIPIDSTVIAQDEIDETVIVGGDTVSIVLPQKNYGRYNRGLHNYLFIPKGQWSFGLMASYGEFSTDDVQLLSVLKNLDLNIKAYSLQPSITYFFRNNQSIGMKFVYVRRNLDSVEKTDSIQCERHDTALIKNRE